MREKLYTHLFFLGLLTVKTIKRATALNYCAGLLLV